MFKYVFKLLTVIFIIAGIAACGGGGSSDPEVIVPETQVLKSVTGVFADDMPIARAVITIIDAAGVTREVTTDDNGLYYIEVNDLELPLLVVGSYTSGGEVHTQYSFVSADKSSADTVTANINEYSSLLVSAMTQQAGVVIDTAPESLSDTNRNLILGVDYLPAIASMEELFCSVLLNSDGTPQGCEWGSSEDILTTSYVPTVDGNSIDKLVALMDISVDTTTGDIIIADSSGVPVATITLNDIVDDTIPADTLTPTDIENINTIYTPVTEITPIENEDITAQLTTSGTVRGVTTYVANFPLTNVFVDNLTECPVESRNFVVTPGDNAETPIVHFAEYQLEIDTSPEFVPVVSRTTISPVDACRSYAFDYQFDYNMVIRKTQTGLVDGVPVWKYDVPACEQYSNKTIEVIQQKTYQYTDVDFDLLLDLPTIEVRPALHRYSESWPNSSVNFAYDPTCPMVAEFSVSPIEGTPSLTVNVDASNSVGNLVSYEWEATGWQTAMTATDQTASFVFDTAGTYTITLTVTDTNGQTDVLSKTVIVDPLPQAAFTSTLGSASNQIKLNAVNSTGTGISYSWTASEAIDGPTKTGQNVDFTFAAPGDYTVTLVVTDKYDNPSPPLSKVVTVEKITALAVDDTFALSGELEHIMLDQSNEVENQYSIDVLANDIGNIGDILSINFPSGAAVRISQDKKSVIMSLSFLALDNGISNRNLGYTFTYTAENLANGGTITGTVTVDVNPTLITKVYQYSVTWYKKVFPVTTGVHPTRGYKVAMINGVYSQYELEDDSVSLPVDWKLSSTTTFVNGVKSGLHEFYSYRHDPTQLGTGIRNFSTCATKSGSYTDGNMTGVWTYYHPSYSEYSPPCSVADIRNY